MPQIRTADIDIDTSVQVRAKIDPDTVTEYAAHITDKKPPLPPIVVFGPDRRGKYFLAEGWHRLEAHRKAGKNTIAATIKDGGWKDALEHAIGSNTTHGLRRTNADKRRCVELALKHWPTWSNRAVADKCMVDEGTVRNFRCGNSAPGENPTSQLQGLTEDEEEEQAGPCVTGKDGKSYKVRPLPKPPKKKPTQTIPVDPHGKPIPPTCMAIWDRRHEVEAMLKSLSEIRATLNKAQDDRDPLWCGNGQGMTAVNFTSAMAHLNQAYADVKAALPHCVCPVCQGVGCRNCSGLGLISEWRLKSVPKDFRP